MVKYALHPGYVIASDGDKHYISAGMLRDLYGLNKSHEWVVWDERESYIGGNRKGCEHLYPKTNGAYYNHTTKKFRRC